MPAHFFKLLPVISSSFPLPSPSYFLFFPPPGDEAGARQGAGGEAGAGAGAAPTHIGTDGAAVQMA